MMKQLFKRDRIASALYEVSAMFAGFLRKHETYWKTKRAGLMVADAEKAKWERLLAEAELDKWR